MNMGRGHPESQRSTAIRSHSFPFGNSELEYVCFGTQGNGFFGPHAPVETSYLAAPPSNFQSAERFSGGVMEPKAEVQVQPAHGLYEMRAEPEVQYEDMWATLETVLIAQEATDQYVNLGMAESFGIESVPTRPRQAHSDAATSCGHKSWDHMLPNGDQGLSSGQTIFSSPTSGSDGPPQVAAQCSYSPAMDGAVSEAMDGAVSEAMDGAVSDGVSSNDNPPRYEVVQTQLPYGYSLRDAHEQEVALHWSRFVEPMNDFTQLLTLGLLGIGKLGETRWAVQLLNLCAAAIASQNVSRTQHLMWVLNELALAQGDVNQRFAAYGLKALFCRVTGNTEAAATLARRRHNEQVTSFGSDRVHPALVRFHDHVPWHQNCYTTASHTLLETCAGKSRLHLIDVGAGKGIEWPIFIDALAGRAGGPPSILRITMIRDRRREEHNLRYAHSVNSEAAVFMTRLVKFASGLGLHMEVNIVTKPLECVTRDDLRLRHGEILAVVTQFRLHRLMEEGPEVLAPRDTFLDFIFSLSPHVFILSDNDGDHCSADFLTRFQAVCGFWWSLFESMDLGYGGQDLEERQIIEYEAGTLMLNQVACEGMARIERNEGFSQWARRVRRAGFVPRPLSDETRRACQALVRNHCQFWDLAFDQPNMVSLRWRAYPTTFTSVWSTPTFCTRLSCKCSMLHS